MSVVTYKSNSSLKNTLYQSGVITTSLNFNLAALSFQSLSTIDLKIIEQRNLSIYIFGRVNDDFGGIIPPADNDVLQPNVTAAFLVNTSGGQSRMDSYYKLVNGVLNIGVVNRTAANITIAAPYYNAVIDYFIFYY